MMRKMMITLFAFLALATYSHATFADIHGKIDIGPTFVRVDVLESGKKVQTMDIWAVKGDATIAFYKGLCLKPGFIVGKGDGRIESYTIGLGHYTPINECLSVIPSFGITYTNLRTEIDVDIPLPFLGPDGNPLVKEFEFKEKFHSWSRYVGLEVCYKLTKKLTLMGNFQYAWSRGHTILENEELDHYKKDPSRSSGPNYSIGLDYSVNDQWSVTLGAGYNYSLSHEKHGLRAKGVKLGVAYYF